MLNDPSRRNPNIKLLTVTVEGFEFTQEYPTGELLGKNYKPGMGLKPLTYGINDYMLLKPVCTNIAGRMQPGCVGFCGKWCKNNQKPWKEKCLQFDDCQGCNACREGEFATCPVLCRLRKDSWAKKCKALPICAQCAECAQVAKEDLQQIDASGNWGRTTGSTGSLQIGSSSGKKSTRLAWQGSTRVHTGQCLCTCERPKCFNGKSTASSFINYLQNSHNGALCPHFTAENWSGLQKCCEKKLMRFEKYVQSECQISASAWANRCRNVPDGSAIQIPNDGTIRNISPNACVAAHWGKFAVAGVVHSQGIRVAGTAEGSDVQLAEGAQAQYNQMFEEEKISGNTKGRTVQIQLGDAFGGGASC